ncbi:hypothetical protein [Burkholderia ubonensis]|uniref:hypothetical protein n=1 Tax=Burkholderia ubonensis TaxID=101571 RepID=UPI0018DF9ABF|nr:hypothetical protein [Burkholderia ubonensis]
MCEVYAIRCWHGPHALIVNPLVEQAQRETPDDVELRTLDFVSCALIATFVTIEARAPIALKPTRQADHLRQQQRESRTPLT